MDHLVAIMEHWKEKNLVIIPIYFKVTRQDIFGLKGKSEAAFLHLQSSVQEDRVQKWKMALAEIASIDGHEWTKGTQVVLAEEVVRNACLRLYLKNSKNLVRILALLNQSQPSDADIVGIWGMAGIGKTSIAREIFGTLAPKYDLCYFYKTLI
ncbi:PREDICTED: probable WRKY transcription factor 19 [Camelina sativa]|nr:PREDICTED: probable WRKY transcription factor 19 [Camelina sativa]